MTSRQDAEISEARIIQGRVVVVVNPATRRNPVRIIEHIRNVTPGSVDLAVLETTRPGDATELAFRARDEADLVVAVGGDGTVAEVATGIRGSNVPLGIVPAGSTNIIARELRLPRDSRRAAAVLFAPHRIARRDVGLCGDRCFLHMAGAGFDSQFFAATNPALKRRLGWLAYLPPAGRTLRLPATRFEIVMDDHKVEVTSPLVLVANGGSIIAPRLRLGAGIRSDDGVFDVLVFTANRPMAVARTVARLMTLRLNDSRYVARYRARRVELIAEPPLLVELDGDVAMSTPVTLSIDPLALKVLVPA